MGDIEELPARIPVESEAHSEGVFYQNPSATGSTQFNRVDDTRRRVFDAQGVTTRSQKVENPKHYETSPLKESYATSLDHRTQQNRQDFPTRQASQEEKARTAAS